MLEDILMNLWMRGYVARRGGELSHDARSRMYEQDVKEAADKITVWAARCIDNAIDMLKGWSSAPEAEED